LPIILSSRDSECRVAYSRSEKCSFENMAALTAVKVLDDNEFGIELLFTYSSSIYSRY